MPVRPAPGAAGRLQRGVRGVGRVRPNPSLRSCFDDFSAAAVDLARWYPELDPYGEGGVTSIAHGSGRLNLTANKAGSQYCQAVSRRPFDVRESSVKMQAVAFDADLIGVERSLILSSGMGHGQADGVQFDFQHTGAGVPILSVFAGWNPMSLKAQSPNLTNSPWWVRCREAGGTTFCEYSSDGSAWTLLYSALTKDVFLFPHRQFAWIQFGLDSGSSGIARTFSVDNLNI